MPGAITIAAASGTGDVTAYTGACRLMGWSFHESAATPAAAELIIRDGTSTSGAIVATINLAGDASSTEWFGPDGIQIGTGVFIDRTAGTSEGTVYIG